MERIAHRVYTLRTLWHSGTCADTITCDIIAFMDGVGVAVNDGALLPATVEIRDAQASATHRRT